MRSILLWMLGIPIPVIILIALSLVESSYTPFTADCDKPLTITRELRLRSGVFPDITRSSHLDRRYASNRHKYTVQGVSGT
jgi:hypothetical protein